MLLLIHPLKRFVFSKDTENNVYSLFSLFLFIFKKLLTYLYISVNIKTSHETFIRFWDTEINDSSLFSFFLHLKRRFNLLFLFKIYKFIIILIYLFNYSST